MQELRRRSSRSILRLSRLGLVAAVLLPACETVVVSIVEVAEIEVVPPSITVIAGDSETASAVVKESGGEVLAGLAVTWTVDDPDIATVTSEGLVEGWTPGTTVVRASSEGVSGAAEVTVLSGPGIGFSTRTIDLDASAGDSPITLEVEVENLGNGTLAALDVVVTDLNGGSVPWLDAELLGTTTPTRLRLLVSPRDLAPGSYEAFVTVDSPATAPADVRVQLRVVAVPEPEPEPEPGELCYVRDRTFFDDVEIRGSCTFINVRVWGRLEVREGARLTASELTAFRQLEANRAQGLILADSRIYGDLKFENGGSVTIRDSYIGKELKLKSNLGAIAVSDNTIGETLTLEDNSGGPFTLLRNGSKKLECKGNDPPPTGGGNVVEDNKTGQCVGL
jgi:hypothetical protein